MIGLVVAALAMVVLLFGAAAALRAGEARDPLGLSVAVGRDPDGRLCVTLRRLDPGGHLSDGRHGPDGRLGPDGRFRPDGRHGLDGRLGPDGRFGPDGRPGGAPPPALVSIRAVGGAGSAASRGPDGPGPTVVGLLVGGQATWVLPLPAGPRTLLRVTVRAGDGRAAAWLWPAAPAALRAPWHRLRGRPHRRGGRLHPGRGRLRTWWASGLEAHRALDARAGSHWRDVGRLGG